MIELINLNNSEPYKIFSEYYYKAIKKKQSSIEAISVSSFNPVKKEVESRFVNIKYIINDQWIFFSNYNSQKGMDFNLHDQVSVLFFWNTIDLQIRIKAKIKKTSRQLSDKHFNNRTKDKNALAISSDQSKLIDSYNSVIRNYENAFSSNSSLTRPEYWGGYAFIPYYFEFWEGHKSRINKRTAYNLQQNNWNSLILQP